MVLHEYYILYSKVPFILTMGHPLNWYQNLQVCCSLVIYFLTIQIHPPTIHWGNNVHDLQNPNVFWLLWSSKLSWGLFLLVPYVIDICYSNVLVSILNFFSKPFVSYFYKIRWEGNISKYKSNVLFKKICIWCTV